MGRTKRQWILYGFTIWAGSAVCTWLFYGADDQRFLLPGATTSGHYQIELNCTACHTPMGGVKTQSCNECHAADLAGGDDSHPRVKFTDPRNADLLASINAADCVTCHREHQPAITGAMGLTQPADYCYYCHQDIAIERPSHEGLGYQTCLNAGCHNFHDNTALYEDFIIRHRSEPDILVEPDYPVLGAVVLASGRTILTAADFAAPAGVTASPDIVAAWAASDHAAAGINCQDCHETTASGGAWLDHPGDVSCATCHESETAGFLEGKHGMRLAAGLDPMTPAMARLPMRAEAAHQTLTCNCCHDAHAYDTRTAAVQSCLQCHDDTHSRAFPGSPHALLWENELAGNAPAGSGVSCATCHLPRETVGSAGATEVRVQHNQNLNLRPNEKMIRTVCLDCHGYGFVLDALADPALIATNFRGRPGIHLDTIEMVLRRLDATESSQE